LILLAEQAELQWRAVGYAHACSQTEKKTKKAGFRFCTEEPAFFSAE